MIILYLIEVLHMLRITSYKIFLYKHELSFWKVFKNLTFEHNNGAKEPKILKSSDISLLLYFNYSFYVDLSNFVRRLAC